MRSIFAGLLLLSTGVWGQGPSAGSSAGLVKGGAPKGDAEWPFYGRDAGGGRYASLAQINTNNVGRLAVAWVYQTGELTTYAGTRMIEKAAFEATPVMVHHTLYFSTPSCRVMALDAASGKEKWVFDPRVDMLGDYSEVSSRGVSVWPVPGPADPDPVPQRVFVATIDGRLIALDATTGKPVETFGEKGTVNLSKGLGGNIQETSPPAIIGNMVIVGSAMGDNQRWNYPSGVIRAYDALSGSLKWSWDPIPRVEGAPGYDTWAGPKAHLGGGANAWSIISTDPVRDLVFLPTTCASPDYYGGERKGKNLYANSIVALRASTGKMVWSYQVVHHDLWDYDIAAQPMLIEIKRKGKAIAAVAVGTKMGHIFVLNRETGAPLFPVEERAVPASTLAGEETSPTQPFPVLPAPLGMQGLSKADAWGLTPSDKQEAETRIGQLINKGPFTPPSTEGTAVTPGNVGGIHWGGMCYDPQQQLLITNINNLAAVIRMLPRDAVERMEKDDPSIMRAETGRQTGTPYVLKRDYLFKAGPQGLVMQTKPPWGTLVAIDLHTGAKKWEVPLGFMLDTAQYPEARKWGSLNFGGAIVTAGNLVFVAASRDGYLRAFDSRTGALLWESLLPAGGQATPMTYQEGGRQYVVIAAGGHGKLKTKQGDYVVAFALPE